MARWQEWLANRFWYVRQEGVLLVRATPAACVQMLNEAAQPSRKRLHLQELFVDGRRYELRERGDQFEVQTTSSHYWRYTEGIFQLRRRTRPVARLTGQMSRVGDDYTRIVMSARIRRLYLLDVIWIPLFVTSIVVPMPWEWWLRGGLVLLLFGLSYTYHYYNAAYQANEMAFFVEKALQDHLVTGLPSMGAQTEDVVRMNADFEQEWERFYQQRRDAER